MGGFFLNNLNMLIEFFKFSDNCDVLGTEFISILNDAWGIIMIVVPIILVVMIILDMIKAITRIIIGVCIYFLPMIVNTILHLAGISSGTCGI